ncbi:MAG: site-specific integrase [Paracoccaceae bacterium]
MNKQPAKVLEPAELRLVLKHVQYTRHPTRNRAMVLLSFKAGLRACEIAGLSWPMVLTGAGKLGPTVNVSRHIAKQGRARCIPIHAELITTLAILHAEAEFIREGPVICSERQCHMTARSVVNWFRDTYAQIGLAGCSSHSGRRTFITRSARVLAKTGGSLRDIQELAGHQALTTTERYIAGNRDAQRKLIALV